MRYILAFAMLLLATPADAQRGDGFAGGIIGGVIGGVIGGAISRPQPAPYPYYPPQNYGGYDYRDVRDVRWCMRRFRSYNPQTGVYFGFDGQYHRCP